MQGNLARDVGRAAELEVAVQLCRRGLEVCQPRPGAKRTDLVASDASGQSQVIEVKATQQTTGNPTWTIPSVDPEWSGVWVLVHYVDENFYDHHPVGSYQPQRPKFYVLQNEQLVELWSEKTGRDGGVRYTKKRMEQYRERWNSIIESDRPDGVNGLTPKQRRANERNSEALRYGYKIADQKAKKKDGTWRKDWDLQRYKKFAFRAQKRYSP